MALGTTAGVIHLPFGERPQYGSPYPEGLAVAHSAIADDASGGDHTFSIVADGGFLYRLELMQLVRGSTTVPVCHAITSHRWASDKSGLGSSSFDLNWVLLGQSAGVGSGFSIYRLLPAANHGAESAITQIRRLPMGRLDNTLLQQLAAVTVISQDNGVTNELSWVWTYWRKESIYLPGFLASFQETPAAPALIRSPI